MKPDGKPYRLSNGTEGDGFIFQWCDRCKRDKAYRDGGYQNGSLGCPILADSFWKQVDEWIYQNGNPICTAFDDEALNITNAEREAQLPLL